MTFVDIAPLSSQQAQLLDAWLLGAEIVRDHGWGLVATTVLEVVHDGDRLIVKAGGETDDHIRREVRAHRKWLQPWVAQGHARRAAAALARHVLA